MEEKGYVRRVFRKKDAGHNDSNEYDLSGLVQAAKKVLAGS
jgi:hypothetical protein